MNYLSVTSENKGADQVHGCRAAVLCFGFHRFSHDEAQLINCCICIECSRFNS